MTFDEYLEYRVEYWSTFEMPVRELDADKYQGCKI